jgi:hypothetical protein
MTTLSRLADSLVLMPDEPLSGHGPEADGVDARVPADGG